MKCDVTTHCTCVGAYSAWGPLSISGSRIFVTVTLNHTDWFDVSKNETGSTIPSIRRQSASRTADLKVMHT